jgi:hypothetical protein
MEATNSSKPLTQRVAGGDSASRQAAALWTTTPLSRASSSRLGWEGWRPSPKSAVCIIATRAWRRQARVRGRARRHARHRERLRRARKNASHTPIFHPLCKAINDAAPVGETLPTPTNAFAADSGLLTIFSERTAVGVPRKRAWPPTSFTILSEAKSTSHYKIDVCIFRVPLGGFWVGTVTNRKWVSNRATRRRAGRVPGDGPPAAPAEVVCEERLGGLLKHYSRRAA